MAEIIFCDDCVKVDIMFYECIIYVYRYALYAFCFKEVNYGTKR